MTNGMKQWIVKTSCLGCVISITAFRRERDSIWDDSMYISTLSEHSQLWHNSWRGRLHFAWGALRGRLPQDIGLDLPEDIKTFKDTMHEVYEWLERKDRRGESETHE